MRPRALLTAFAGIALLAPPAAAQQLGGAPTRPSVSDGLLPERKLLVWFGVVDSDGDGWLSYRETARGLHFDRKRFRVFDKDRDGRMTTDEYRGFYIDELKAGRTPPEPRATPTIERPPQRDAQQLRAAYDRDLDGALDQQEIERMFIDYALIDDVNPRMVLGRLDSNADGRLSIEEMSRLVNLVRPTRTRGVAAARTLDELFGMVFERAGGQPPHIPGPIPPFRRLDLDNDGFIEADDLEDLRGRMQSPIRTGSVLHTLDLDHDGKLSEAEFLASITNPRRAADASER